MNNGNPFAGMYLSVNQCVLSKRVDVDVLNAVNELADVLSASHHSTHRLMEINA